LILFPAYINEAHLTATVQVVPILLWHSCNVSW